MAMFRIEKAPDSVVQKADTIAVIFFFYGATERAMKKYCNTYHSYGFDVMYVPTSLKIFARPSKTKRLAGKLLLFLKRSCTTYNRIVIHAFSMGAYYFSVCMREMYRKPDMYGSIQQYIKAIIYDSLTIDSLNDLATLSGQNLTHNKIAQAFIRFTLSMFFLLTYPWTVTFYHECEELFKQKPLKVPTLLYTCENDQLCRYELIQSILKNWHEMSGVQSVFKSWEQSMHCAHLLLHKDDYIHVLSDFLNSVPDLITQITRL